METGERHWFVRGWGGGVSRNQEFHLGLVTFKAKHASEYSCQIGSEMEEVGNWRGLKYLSRNPEPCKVMRGCEVTWVKRQRRVESLERSLGTRRLELVCVSEGGREKPTTDSGKEQQERQEKKQGKHSTRGVRRRMGRIMRK